MESALAWIVGVTARATEQRREAELLLAAADDPTMTEGELRAALRRAALQLASTAHLTAAVEDLQAPAPPR